MHPVSLDCDMADPDLKLGGLCSLVDFSRISEDSLSYPSSYKISTTSRSLSLFDSTVIESSSSTDYQYRPIGDFVHLHEINIPASLSGHFAQDEGYVTPDFDADDTAPYNDPNYPEIHESLESEEEKPHSWAALLGYGIAEKPLLSNYGDPDESVQKILWPVKNRRIGTWHRHDPVPVSIEHFLNDLKYLLAGVPTRTFQWNSDSNTFILSPNFKLSSHSDEFVKTYAEELMVCGNSARHLECISQNDMKVRHGLVYNTLCQTVGVHLQGIRGIILNMDLSNCDLASVSYITLPIRNQLVMMSNTCQGFESEKLTTGGEIIDRLFKELQSIPSSDGAFAIYSVLQPCLGVYFKFLFKWIFKGEINDAYQEFFIDRKFPHVISNSRNFWTRGFTCIDKLMPSFLMDLRDDILACGKTMCLLKTCDPNNVLFQLIEESNVELNVCNDYNSFEELWEVLKKYHQLCKKQLGACFTFSFRESQEVEKSLLEAAALAQERNMILYEERRRKKLQEIADKKYKQLLDLKQQIENLNLKKEQEKRLREEVEREWLEQIKKEQELDMILEQTKQAKIGEFYKSLLEASQKKVALTTWKIKRSELHEQRVEFFCSERKKLNEKTLEDDPSNPHDTVDNIPSLVYEGPLTNSDKRGTDYEVYDSPLQTETASKFLSLFSETPPTKEKIKADQATDQLILSFIENLDDNMAQSLETQLDSAKGISVENIMAVESKSANEANYEAWLNDKGQALKNKEKVLSSGVNNIINDDPNVDSYVERQKLKQVFGSIETFRESIDNLPKTKVTGTSNNSPASKTQNFDSCSSSNFPKVLDDESAKFDHSDSKIESTVVETNPLDPRNKKDTSSNILKDKESPVEICGSKSNPNESIESSGTVNSYLARNSSAVKTVPVPHCPVISNLSQKGILTEPDSVTAETSAIMSVTNTSDATSSKTEARVNPCKSEDQSRLSQSEDKYSFNLSKIPLKTDIIDQILSDSKNFRKNISNAQIDFSLTLSLCIESIQLPLRIHTAIANFSLMKYFVHKLELMTHLNFMKDYFMLHNTSFRSSFIKILSQTLRDYKGLDIGRFDVSFILVEALAHSNLNELDGNQCLSLSLQNAPQILDITDLEVFDCFSLHYSVDWPLNIIITPDAISRYNTIFQFFLKIMYVDHVLMNQFKHLSNRSLRNSPQYKKVCLFRHSMTQFIHPLACFISESIVESQFTQLLEELEKDCRIDSFYYKHVEFVKSVIFNCFLSAKSEAVLWAFKTLFKNVLQFNEALVQGSWILDRASNQLVHSNFSKLEMYFGNFIHLVADTCNYMKKLSESGYQVKLHNFTAQLSLSAVFTNEERP